MVNYGFVENSGDSLPQFGINCTIYCEIEPYFYLIAVSVKKIFLNCILLGLLLLCCFAFYLRSLIFDVFEVHGRVSC